jgi:hypothetical protein
VSSFTPSFPPYIAVPHSRLPRRPGERRVRTLAILALVVVTAIVTAVAVLSRPTSQPCGTACGPPVSTAPAAAIYTNAAHGFSIAYPPSQLQVAVDQQDVVEFHSGGGPIEFAVVSAASLDDAVSQAVQALPSSSFQDLQEVGPVRGAEIGFVPGTGTVWSATYVGGGGRGSLPVRVAVIAAQSGGLMVVATMFSAYDSGTAHAPYGLSDDAIFDYPVSNFHFPGQ